MAKFIALPVGQGDAFYLDRGNCTILVDGGKSKSALPEMFRNVTGKNSVDIIVCTHNDADHVNGVLGLLESEIRCQELWLPGRWLDLLPEILPPLHNVSKKIFAELKQKKIVIEPGGHPRYPESVDEYTSAYEAHYPSSNEQFPRDFENERNDVDLGDDGWPASIVEDLQNAEPWDTTMMAWPYTLPIDWIDFYYDTPQSARKFLSSAIEAATRIREAAILAFHRGVTVRWFEYFPSAPSGGEPEVLVPMNARQLLKMHQRRGSLIEYISLSVSNRESLVFWAPPTDKMPGVLFNADSDLAGVSLSEDLENALATAPHHGSESNAAAYDVVQAYALGRKDSVTWIRSDGRFLKRPGHAYLKKTNVRFCTLCRPGRLKPPRPKQTVRLFTQRGKWARHKDCQICVC